jgi:pyruvate/2-oxoglutarate dehydrogenase complex dihydrolipoamide dehydrogenase (E3) component
MTALSLDYDVAVLGAGPAGLVAALRAAELGRRTVVLQDGPLGGTCVHTGCVPTRVLAKTARLLRDLRGSGEYGIDTGPATVHWDRLKTKVQRVIGQILAAKAIPEHLDRADVQLITEDRARFVDPHTLELAASGRQVTAETVIIAVGGHSRRLPVPGIEHTLIPEHLLDLAELPRSVAIVGSGNTGAQLVTVLGALGAEVTLLETQPRILPTADADAVLHRSFTDQGVHAATGIGGVRAVEPLPDGRRRLRHDRGGTDHTLEVDQVIMSVGWPPTLDGLELEAAGISLERGRISVDRYRRSRVPTSWSPATPTAKPPWCRPRWPTAPWPPLRPPSDRAPWPATTFCPPAGSPTPTTARSASPSSSPGRGPWLPGRHRPLRRHRASHHRQPHHRAAQADQRPPPRDRARRSCRGRGRP